MSLIKYVVLVGALFATATHAVPVGQEDLAWLTPAQKAYEKYDTAVPISDCRYSPKVPANQGIMLTEFSCEAIRVKTSFFGETVYVTLKYLQSDQLAAMHVDFNETSGAMIGGSTEPFNRVIARLTAQYGNTDFSAIQTYKDIPSTTHVWRRGGTMIYAHQIDASIKTFKANFASIDLFYVPRMPSQLQKYYCRETGVTLPACN